MPLYEIEAGGKRYQVDAADEAGLHEAVKGLTGGAPQPEPTPVAPATNMGFGERAQREAEPTRDQRKAAYAEQFKGQRDRQGGILANVDSFMGGLARSVPFAEDLGAAVNHYVGGQGESFQDAKDRIAAQGQVDLSQRTAATLAGNVAGGVALPGGALASSGIKGAAAVGAGYGALYGAGTGDTVGDRALNAAGGAAVGSALGAGSSVAITGLGALAGKASDMLQGIAAPVRGALNTDAEALRRIGGAFQRDAATGQGMTAAEMAAARAEGAPIIAADAGGSAVRSLARSSANSSPEARAALEGAVMERSASQGPRIADRVAEVSGATGDVEGVRAALQRQAQAANRPAYARAYAEGGEGVWDEGFAQIASAPAVQSAIKKATTTGANRAAADGFAPVKNPFIEGANGQMQLKGDAVPNLQFWDHVKRNLDDKYETLKRAGAKSEAGDVLTLKDQLVSYLDQAVPSYKKARAGAAEAFGAQDALDAGSKFIGANIGHAEARRAVAKMSEPERKLFADGFASSLVEKINGVADRRDVVNAVFGTPKARERVEIALGRGKATELEMSLRLETIMTQTKNQVVGNSTTARQLAEYGLAGGVGGAAGAYQTGDFSGFTMGSAFGAAARFGAMKIDARVAQRVGEMLASEDPAIKQKALTQIARTPALQNLVRKVEEMVVKGSAQGSGAVNEITVRPLIGGMRPALSADPQQEDQRQR